MRTVEQEEEREIAERGPQIENNFDLDTEI